MKTRLISLIITTIIFCSCSPNQPKSKIVEVGDLDSSAVAQDTGMQKAFESSYEYAQTVHVSEHLVYDIRAYGGSASEGEYAILRRGADNKADTAIINKREGIIANALTADLNKNGLEEIYIITQSVGSGSYGNVFGFEFDKTGKADTLLLPMTKIKADGQYLGHDSIYIENYFLVRQFPLYKADDPNCCPSNGKLKIHYTLKKNMFAPAKTEQEK